MARPFQFLNWNSKWNAIETYCAELNLVKLRLSYVFLWRVIFYRIQELTTWKIYESWWYQCKIPEGAGDSNNLPIEPCPRLHMAEPHSHLSLYLTFTLLLMVSGKPESHCISNYYHDNFVCCSFVWVICLFIFCLENYSNDQSMLWFLAVCFW